MMRRSRCRGGGKSCALVQPFSGTQHVGAAKKQAGGSRCHQVPAAPYVHLRQGHCQGLPLSTFIVVHHALQAGSRPSRLNDFGSCPVRRACPMKANLATELGLETNSPGGLTARRTQTRRPPSCGPTNQPSHLPPSHSRAPPSVGPGGAPGTPRKTDSTAPAFC